MPWILISARRSHSVIKKGPGIRPDLRKANSKKLSLGKALSTLIWLRLIEPARLASYGPQFPLRHSPIGPASFVLLLMGAAIAKHVQATATTRTKVLTARFIHFLLTCGSPGSGNPSGWNYNPIVKESLGARCFCSVSVKPG